MKIPALAILAILAASPALAQSQQYRPLSQPSDSPGRLPPSDVIEGSPNQQQAELPAQPEPKKHPGKITKLRGGFNSSPNVEGDEFPQNGLGLPEQKKRQ
jgi:hypothetical protein